jgi:phosphate transport system protein
MSHYEQRLEADLDNIILNVRNLASQVGGALHNAVEALLSGDATLAHTTVLGDNPINRDSRNVDRLCHAFIARHLPSAGHLRLMSATVRANVALERIGDYAVTISRESLQLPAPPREEISKVLKALAWGTESLLEDAIAAFCDRDEEKARALMPDAKRMELGMDRIYSDLFDSKSNPSNRETISIFVVYNQLKRVADQAKNICDQTVFATTGEAKASKAAKILFIDAENSRSQLAEALARKMFPHSGRFSSAGADPADSVNPHLLAFLEDRGLEPNDLSMSSLDSIGEHLGDYKVVISLDRPVQEYLPQLPFHTSALNWDIEALPADLSGDELTARFESLYRSLGARIDDLMQILVGDDAS